MTVFHLRNGPKLNDSVPQHTLVLSQILCCELPKKKKKKNDNGKK
ncbi:MAG: hypothetical protein ABIH48_03000 [Candidatus Falkowbacteria bacterium]